jgi:hypothetical protein
MVHEVHDLVRLMMRQALHLGLEATKVWQRYAPDQVVKMKIPVVWYQVIKPGLAAQSSAMMEWAAQSSCGSGFWQCWRPSSVHSASTEPF